MLTQHTDSAAATQFANERGIYSFGQDSDQIKFGPKAQLTAIVNNSRYDNTIPRLKADILLDKLNKNEETRALLKKEHLALADKEAPTLLRNAKNYATNNQPKAAKKNLDTVIEKFPDTPYADEAKKQLETLASGK